MRLPRAWRRVSRPRWRSTSAPLRPTSARWALGAMSGKRCGRRPPRPATGSPRGRSRRAWLATQRSAYSFASCWTLAPAIRARATALTYLSAKCRPRGPCRPGAHSKGAGGDKPSSPKQQSSRKRPAVTSAPRPRLLVAISAGRADRAVPSTRLISRSWRAHGSLAWRRCRAAPRPINRRGPIRLGGIS
jgi:hypothetical protein